MILSCVLTIFVGLPCMYDNITKCNFFGIINIIFFLMISFLICKNSSVGVVSR